MSTDQAASRRKNINTMIVVGVLLVLAAVAWSVVVKTVLETLFLGVAGHCLLVSGVLYRRELRDG